MAARSEPLMLYSTKRICAAIWTAVLLALLQYSETASELISHVLSLLSFKRVMLSHAARVRRWHGCVCAPTTVAPRARHVFHPGGSAGFGKPIVRDIWGNVTVLVRDVHRQQHK